MSSDKTKFHHFIPKLVLRGFSPDEKRIGVLIKNKTQRFYTSNIKSEGGKKYLYGKDGQIECFFQKIENDSAVILRKIKMMDFSHVAKRDSTSLLLYFMFMQRFRTPSHAENINNFIKTVLLKSLEKSIELNGMTPIPEFMPTISGDLDLEYIASLLISQRNPLNDLHLKVLRSSSDFDFILGDCGVVITNPWRSNGPNCGIFGLSSKGIQVYLPISRQLCLIAYDPSVYMIGKKNSTVVGICANDVKTINSAQYVSSSEKIYFDPRSNTNQFNYLSSISGVLSVDSFARTGTDQESGRSYLISVQGGCQILSLPIFSKIKKKATRNKRLSRERLTRKAFLKEEPKPTLGAKLSKIMFDK